MASLATVDGAVVMNRRFELLGFGGEITVAEPVPQIHRAVDLEATETIAAMVDGEGTRHRSVYRLCQAVPDSLAFVVSQDGGITVVHARDQPRALLGPADVRAVRQWALRRPGRGSSPSGRRP